MKNYLSALAKKAHYVSLRDIIGIYKFLIALIPSIIYGAYIRVRKKQLWLICEREDMARDNGSVFFEYMQKNHAELKTYYAIDKKNDDYTKLKKYNKSIIQWASLKHYFLYMSATRNISSHKEGSPNQTIFTILHLWLKLYNNRVFLQHGITKDDAPMFYYKNTRIRMFVCGAKPEYDYISSHFGYPDGYVKYTGFARYDKLVNKTKKGVIAFVPTWRRWINDENIEGSSYKENVLGLLNDKRLEKYLETHNKIIWFYPHINVRKYFHESEIKNPYVAFIKSDNSAISKIICEAELLITDYSSLFFDFAYLKKPVVYYQPDYKEYREKHGLKEGYFDYRKDGFGPVAEDVSSVIKMISNKSVSSYAMNRNKFFVYNDSNNCQRIYEEIMNNA